jgi:hypothetical protein
MRKTLSALFVVIAVLFGLQAPASASWGPLGTEAASDAVVVVSGPDVYAFVVDVNGQLVLHQDNTAVGPQVRPLGGILTSAPAAVVHTGDSDAVYVFGRGADGALWYQRVTATTSSGWNTLGGFFNGTPTAAMGDGDDVLNVFVRGGDDALWHRSIAGTGPEFTQWQSFGGTIIDDPTAATIDDTFATVAAIGTDGALWTGQVTTLGWSGWTSLGGELASYPWMVGHADEGYVFAIGLDSAMWFDRRTATGSWTGWQSLGGQFLSGPGGYDTPSGPIALGVGLDEAGWRNQVSPTGGAGWIWIDGSFVSNIFGAQRGGSNFTFGVGQDGQLYRTTV